MKIKTTHEQNHSNKVKKNQHNVDDNEQERERKQINTQETIGVLS